MYNAMFPVRVDEIVHPDFSSPSFLKVFVQPRRGLSSTPSNENNGFNQSSMSVLITNRGDNVVGFKVMAALRSHAAEHQTDGMPPDTAYSEVVATQPLQPGGFVQFIIDEPEKNLFSFVTTGGGPTTARVEISSAADLTVWKSYERESEKNTHLDEFLKDETPLIFYSTSSPSSGA